MEILRGLLLPIQNKTLVLPYSAVAEIVALKDSTAYAESKDWVLGKFSWRGRDIPLVCLEMSNREATRVPQGPLHVAVLNRISESSPDFIGIVLQGLPIMSRFKKIDLEFVTTPSIPYVLSEILVKKKPAFIPNIVWIAENILKQA